MRNIAEMTAIELYECLCKIADPAESLLSDVAVRAAMDEFKKNLPKNVSVEHAFSMFATVLFPVLSGESHRAETYAILAALDGVKVNEIESRNGLEVMRDMFKTFVIDGEVQAIFRPVCEARSK